MPRDTLGPTNDVLGNLDSVVSGGGHYVVGPDFVTVQAQAATALTPGTPYAFSIVDNNGTLIDFGGSLA